MTDYKTQSCPEDATNTRRAQNESQLRNLDSFHEQPNTKTSIGQ